MNRADTKSYPLSVAALAVLALLALNAFTAPQKVEVWAAMSVAVLAAIGAAPCIARRMSTRSPEERAAIKRSVFLALLTIGVALTTSFLKHAGYADGAVAKRFAGLVIGGVLIACGDQLPKFVPSLAARGRAPARTAAAERFVGRVLVLGGGFYIAAWLLMPIDRAPLGSSLIGFAAFAMAAAAGVWAHAGAARERV
ncbi:MAG: hypothetical protein AAFR11_01910 [Pseudomonadota bacterium]